MTQTTKKTDFIIRNKEGIGYQRGDHVAVLYVEHEVVLWEYINKVVKSLKKNSPMVTILSLLLVNTDRTLLAIRIRKAPNHKKLGGETINV